MRNPSAIARTLGALAVGAAIVTVASAQTPPTQSPERPATDEGAARSGSGTSSSSADKQSAKDSEESKDKDRRHATSGETSATSASSRPSDAVTRESPLRLRAFAVDVNRGGSATATLDVVIERWSTDAERDKLRGVLVEKGGGDALRAAVQKISPRAGYIRSATSTGWDIRFARETAMADGSRRIVFGTDRPMSFWEAANRPRSADYEFLVGEVRIDKDGKGDGRLVPAAAVGYDEDTRTIEIENYDTLPVNLTQVTVVGGKGSHK